MSTVIFRDSQKVIQEPIQSLFSPRETIATQCSLIAMLFINCNVQLIAIINSQSSLIAIASQGNANEKVWFLWRHVKIQNCKSCIINHKPRLKCLIFLCFESNYAKLLDEQEIKISTHMKKFYFWVKTAVFIKNKNEFVKNSYFWFTWSNYHIQQVFQIFRTIWSIF